MEAETFEGWAIVELMGHRRLRGNGNTLNAGIEEPLHV